MTKIFISYRLDDSQDSVSRICAELNKYIEPDSDDTILADAAVIPPGPDFQENLSNAVRSSNALLVAIGNNWLAAKDNDGTQLLQDPADIVRTEIESALVYGVPVIPVLIDGSMLPLATQVPRSILDITNTIASPVRAAPDFDNDIERLTTRIKSHLKHSIERDSISNSGQRSYPLLSRIRTTLTDLRYTALFLAIAMILSGIFIFFNAASNQSDNETTVPIESNVLSFVTTTQPSQNILSEIHGTVEIDNNYLEVTTKSGVIESRLDAKQFVQNVRFGLAKKSYAFDRFRVISWAEPHSIERWIDNNSSLKLASLNSKIPVPPTDANSSLSKNNSELLKNHWLVFKVTYREENNSNSLSALAHSDKSIFSVR